MNTFYKSIVPIVIAGVLGGCSAKNHKPAIDKTNVLTMTYFNRDYRLSENVHARKGFDPAYSDTLEVSAAGLDMISERSGTLSGIDTVYTLVNAKGSNPSARDSLGDHPQDSYRCMITRKLPNGHETIMFQRFDTSDSTFVYSDGNTFSQKYNPRTAAGKKGRQTQQGFLGDVSSFYKNAVTQIRNSYTNRRIKP